MPFDDLVHVIETLKERIGAHRQSLQSNETRTRMALIDPLLRALGWDTEDPALVLPEYESSGRADYALLGGAGKPSAVIEAKRLGESLANHRGQMVNYANMSGIPYAGLTDGNIWEFYDVFDRKPLEERRLLHVSIANDAAHECALKLLLLWRANLASGQPIQPSTPVLADSAELQPPPSPPAPSSSKPVSPPSSEGWIALTEFDTPAGAPAPEAIRFPDGEEVSTAKSWRLLLVESATWLDRQKLIRPGSTIPSGPWRHVLNHRPVHQSGKEFTKPFRLTESETYLDLDINTSAPGRLKSVRRLIEGCDQDPALVYVRPRT